MTSDFKRTKAACYYSYLSMSSIFCVPSILFVTFHETYGVSYTLLGTLVLANFCTQLLIDLVFTFFSKKFNIKLTVRLMPMITSLGLLIYAVFPMLFPNYAYLGLLLGTILFSVSAGLSEVLMSPIIAAIPSDNPERDMSALHSLYAWGVVIMVIISTFYLRVFGTANWMYLIIFLALLPLGASLLFSLSEIPDLNLTKEQAKESSKNLKKGIALCTICIFLGGATENLMTNWISGFMENAVHIPKEWCDVIGIAIFAALLGSIRSWYAKFGKNIIRMLFVGMIGAVICYLTAGLSLNPIAVTIACVMTGLCAGMLWPGTLILMEQKMPSLGVAAYALMAAGGDLGSSISPQLMGIITDMVSTSDNAISLANRLSLTPEQIGMKAGMLVSAIFPICGIIVLILIKKHFQKAS